MRHIQAVLFMILIPATLFAIPPFELKDQSGNATRSGDLSEGTTALVYYSSRKPSEFSKGHYETMKRALPAETQIVRIANIKRAPGFIHFLIFMMVKNEQPAYPLLFDPTGVSAGRFGIDDEQCGFFLYRDGKEIWSFRALYTNETLFGAVLSNMAESARRN